MVKIFNYENDSKEFAANTYIIGKINGDCVVIDMGSTDEKIYEYIDAHYEKVEAVLLTHAHFYHIRGLSKFIRHYKNKYDIPVYLSGEDEELLKDPHLNSSLMMNEKVQISIATLPVNDGDELKLKNFRIQVIHTPFHTKGSVCYLFDDDNALFTGDTLFKGSIGRTDLPSSEPEKVEESLNKLKNLRDTLVVYPGHGPISRLEIEKETNPFFK